MNLNPLVLTRLKTLRTEISQLKGYKEEMKTIEDYIKRLESRDIIKIVNTGLVNSGKSTLFNALLNKNDDEGFKTGAARTTVKSESEYMEKDICLIDTPGIDAREEDDEKAYRSVVMADIIVVIHNIKTGMPNRQEMEWFERICSDINSKDQIKKRLVYVCSWIDERDRDADYINTINTTKEMVFKAAGTEVDFFEVSSKRYKAGIKKSSQGLIQLSNIDPFRQALLKKARLAKADSTLDEGLRQSVYDFCSSLYFSVSVERKEKSEKINKITQKNNNKCERLLNNWKNTFDELKQRKTNLDKLKGDNSGDSMSSFLDAFLSATERYR